MRRTQVRGGTGVFTGRPAYVWISNQIGNTGVLTGFEQLDNTTTRPFNPDPNRYKPTTPPTGAPAATYELALHRSRFQVPADLAQQHRRRSAAAGRTSQRPASSSTTRTSTASTTSTPTCRRRRQRSSAPTIGRAGRTTASTRNISERRRAEEPGRRVIVEHRASRSRSVPGRRAVLPKAPTATAGQRTRSMPARSPFGSWAGNPHSGDPNNPGLAYSCRSEGRWATASSRWHPTPSEYFGFGQRRASRCSGSGAQQRQHAATCSPAT